MTTAYHQIRLRSLLTQLGEKLRRGHPHESEKTEALAIAFRVRDEVQRLIDSLQRV